MNLKSDDLKMKEYLAKYASDRVRATSGAWLGSTLGCAECHDHKFDPISQAEYYQFFSFFNSLDEKQAGYSKFVGAEPFIRVPNPEQAAQIQSLTSNIADAESKIQTIGSEADSSLSNYLASTSPTVLAQRYGTNLRHHFPLEPTDHNVTTAEVLPTKDSSTIDASSTSRSFEWKEGKSKMALALNGASHFELPEVSN